MEEVGQGIVMRRLSRKTRPEEALEGEQKRARSEAEAGRMDESLLTEGERRGPVSEEEEEVAGTEGDEGGEESGDKGKDKERRGGGE